jgi:RNA polymerase sigma-70 factor (ECF subfamily)
MGTPDTEIPLTALLARTREGDRAAESAVMDLVYQEIRRLAAFYMKGERQGHTLQATALTHEVYLRMFRGEGTPGENRAQFFAIVSRRLREVLIDHARKRRAGKRGGQQVKVPLDMIFEPAHDDYDSVDIKRALEQLGQESPRAARVIALKYMVGFGTQEISEHMSLSQDVVRRLTTEGRQRLNEILTETR